MSKIHIDEVQTKGPLHPMLINFQNGYASDNFPPTKCSLFSNENTGKKTVFVELNGLAYAGEEEEDTFGRNLLLARNKKTGKVRIIEVGSANLKPILDIDNEAANLLETSNLELSRKFGSKKQKQQVEQREKLKVNVETVTEQMQNVTETIGEEKVDLAAYNKTDSDEFYIPPIDKTAAKPEDVYEITKILNEEDYEKIYSELEEKNYENDLLPFIKSLISGKKLSKRHTVLAVYADTLLKFAATMAKDLVKKNYAPCTLSPTLNRIILDKFTVMSNGRRNRPMPYKDKALCHAIVFALIINGLKFNLEGLCVDTKMTVTNAITKVRVTGASIVTSGSKKTVQLKLPLATKSFIRRKSAKF